MDLRYSPSPALQPDLALLATTSPVAAASLPGRPLVDARTLAAARAAHQIVRRGRLRPGGEIGLRCFSSDNADSGCMRRITISSSLGTCSVAARYA